MVFFSTVFALLVGFPLGVLLSITNPYGINPKPVFNLILSRIIDVFRSFPFVILMIVLLPFTRFVLGTSIGTTATIIPLSLAAAERRRESSLHTASQFRVAPVWVRQWTYRRAGC